MTQRKQWVFLVAVTAVVVASFAASAEAKFGVTLGVTPAHPQAGQPVHLLIRIGEAQPATCKMRLLVVAPGVDPQKALDAFVGGPIHAAPSLGFLASTHRSSPTLWRATVTFTRKGRWHLIVPNWCAPGYASPLPASRIISVR